MKSCQPADGEREAEQTVGEKKEQRKRERESFSCCHHSAPPDYIYIIITTTLYIQFHLFYVENGSILLGVVLIGLFAEL